MAYHLYEEILQRQRTNFQGTRLLWRCIKDITRCKASYRILADHIQILGCSLHIFVKSADAERFGFDRLQGVKEADASFIKNDQLLDRLCDLFDDVRGYDNDPRVLPEAVCQHVIKLHAHNRIEAKDGFIQEDDLFVARQADNRGHHRFHAERKMMEFLLSIQFKTLHHLRGEIIIIVRVYFGSDPQQFPHRQIEMLCKIFNIADARIQSGCGDCLPGNLNRTVCNVLSKMDSKPLCYTKVNRSKSK